MAIVERQERVVIPRDGQGQRSVVLSVGGKQVGCAGFGRHISGKTDHHVGFGPLALQQKARHQIAGGKLEIAGTDFFETRLDLGARAPFGRKIVASINSQNGRLCPGRSRTQCCGSRHQILHRILQ